ncbi:HAD family hydrolase [Halobacterium zhouii]|uniref:HAD family hydrolase n=1 Tax=Halobacterium zhouii TaxID=2902624 RepID=UPI001E3FE85E|nr:HAD family hydrolase [Halobacterium zhouii]
MTDGSAADDVDADEYAAVVYDLDGTLADLDVDWAQVESEVGARLREVGVDPDHHETWELLSAAEDAGIGAQVNALISQHEIGGALRSTRLPTVDELAAQSVPVGVCSLNCELAVRAALEKHDLDGLVDVVVGRDTVASRKPDPGPLLAAVEELGVEPADVLFVGDSEKDAETAERAGTKFQWV